MKFFENFFIFPFGRFSLCNVSLLYFFKSGSSYLLSDHYSYGKCFLPLVVSASGRVGRLS